MDKNKKAKSILWGILHPTMNRRAHVVKDYFDQRSSPGSPNLRDYANITSPLPDHLNNYEVVGALILFLFSKNTPIPIMAERYVIHDTWKKRFNESFFLIAEEVARDFQIKGFKVISLRLLGYCERIAIIIGRPEIAERFKERKKSIFRGRHPRRQP